PFTHDPAFEEHALQRRVERAFFHLQNVFGGLLDGIGDPEAMQFARFGKRFQDQHVECPGRNFVALPSYHIDNLCQERLGRQLSPFCGLLVRSLAMQTSRNFLQSAAGLAASLAPSLSAADGPLVSQRPPAAERKFTSEAVEGKIQEVKKAISDPQIAW